MLRWQESCWISTSTRMKTDHEIVSTDRRTFKRVVRLSVGKKVFVLLGKHCLQLHGNAHVAFDLELAAHKSLHSIHLTC